MDDVSTEVFLIPSPPPQVVSVESVCAIVAVEMWTTVYPSQMMAITGLELIQSIKLSRKAFFVGPSSA